MSKPFKPTCQDIIFPVEIWRYIFEILYEDSGQKRFAPFVRFLSATRRDVEVLLYSKPQIKGGLSGIRFAKSLTDPEYPYRANAVREITFKMFHTDRKRANAYFDAMQAVFDKLPSTNLVSVDFQRVHIRLGIAPLPDLSIGSVFRDHSFPLRQLRGEPMLLNEDAAQFLHRHCNLLEDVRIVTVPPTQSAPIAPGSPVSLSGLKFPKLRKLGCDVWTLNQIKDTSSLTHLWIMDKWDSSTGQQAVALLGEQLVSLRVDQHFRAPAGAMFPTQRSAQWERCTRLQFLQLEDFPAQPWTLVSSSCRRISNWYKIIN